ncbi:MAG: ribose transport system substrate-binding protein [Thermoleophilales bacterium]|nr:ribose transport system substrate-binding protein [Thermoleophilales bacterium]
MSARLALAVLLTAMLAADGGCGGDSSNPPPRDATVAATIKGLDNAFFVTMRDGLLAGAKQQKTTLRVEAAATLDDSAGQASRLESQAADGAGCYIVNPISATNLIEPLAHIPRGAPIVNLDNAVDRNAAKAVGVRVNTYIGTDNEAAGRLGANAVAGLVDNGAPVALLVGVPGDVPSEGRARAFAAAARGRFRIADRVAADYDRGRARLAAGDLLATRPDLQAFFAVNDEMALGVADAVRAAGGHRRVAVVGVDGIREALTAVRNGQMSATVAQYPFTMGQLGVEACVAIHRGKRVPARIDAPTQTVTRANVARAQANFPQPVNPYRDPIEPLLAK